MKNLKITFAVLGLIILASACRMNSRHVVITDGDSYRSIRIEYYGSAYFNGDTAIAHISPHGSVLYKRDGRELIAESDNNGRVVYQLDDGEKQIHLNVEGKAFLAQAVKDMVKHGHNKD